MGHEVDVVDAVMDDPVDLWNAEFYAGVGTRLRAVIEDSPELIDPAVLEVLKVAISQEMGDYYAKVFERYAFRERMRELFSQYDLLVSPTVPVTGVRGRHGRARHARGPDHRLLGLLHLPVQPDGQPAASLPVGFSARGLPIGMQVVGAINDEATVFELSGQYERAHGETDRRPPLAS